MSHDPPIREVICPYCGLNAELIDSALIYRQSYGLVWICKTCEAWVGVHEGSKSARPKGTLAKRELRALRIEAHAVFDPLWKSLVGQGVSRRKARKRLYQDLAGELGIDEDDCHIGMFNEQQCRQTIEICLKWREAATDAAASRGEKE